MYRSGHALFLLSPKGPRCSVVEASANHSDPVTRNFLTKTRKPKERELPKRGDPTGCQELRNPGACTASQLSFVGEEALGANYSQKVTLGKNGYLFFREILRSPGDS